MSKKGLKHFLMAQHWLWTMPRNAEVLASRFQFSTDCCSGKKFWVWIERIAALKEKKIVWDDELINSRDTEHFAISADGIDFKLWEVQHPTLPKDKKTCSHKMKHCAARYVLVLSVFQSKCFSVLGPFYAGKTDTTILSESGLMEKLVPAGKVCIVDRGFRVDDAVKTKHLSFPDLMDPKHLHSFKTRARCRQEAFNSRITHFECMANTFRHGIDKHAIALNAVVVTVQYQMDNGSPLFDV